MEENTRLVGTAYHEAGHAVMARVLRRPVSSITIVPSPDSDGQCWVPVPGQFQPDAESNWRTREAVECEVKIFFAGPLAEHFKTGSEDWRSAKNDLKRATSLLGNQAGSDEELSFYFKWLWVRAADMLRLPAHWNAIDTLATELLRKRDISGRRVSEIVRHSIQASMRKCPSCSKCGKKAFRFYPAKNMFVCIDHETYHKTKFPRLDEPD